MVRKTILISFFFLLSNINSKSQQIIKHHYALDGNFVTIRLIDYLFVEISFFPDNNYKYSGQCIVSGDTLRLDIKPKNDSITKTYNYPVELSILETLSKLKIVRNFFIPFRLIDSTYNPVGVFENSDEQYIFSSYTINKDYTYHHYNGDCVLSYESRGTWKQNGNLLIFSPKEVKEQGRIIPHTERDFELYWFNNFIIIDGIYNGIRYFSYYKKK